MITGKHVLIIGSGMAGLTTALDLAAIGVSVDIVEQFDFAGGQGIRLSCKATDICVKCGACAVDDRLGKALGHRRIRLFTGSNLESVSRKSRFLVRVRHKPAFIDPSKCNNCGLCFQQCPVKDAVVQGTSGYHHPFYAISEKACLYRNDKGCGTCRDVCPTKAIDLDVAAETENIEADAVVVAAGFSTFRPQDKPYGYGVFPNVVTGPELDLMLKRHGKAIRPSDGIEPCRIAFIQCVGSRDAKLGHLWCSAYCCGSALRSARLIGHRQPNTGITLFYIDIQSFGRCFDAFYIETREKIRTIRSIPGDIYPADEGRLLVTYMDPESANTLQEDFDLAVLSVAMTPPETLDSLLEMLPLEKNSDGFLVSRDQATQNGIFPAGAVTGPMSLSDAMASGAKTAWQVIQYLEGATP